MTTDASRQAVFNTAELLEAILLHVPMKQLFTIRRVSQQFRDCISTSVMLREKMFLRHGKPAEKWTLRNLRAPETHGLKAQDVEFVPNSNIFVNDIRFVREVTPVRVNPLLTPFVRRSGCDSALWLWHGPWEFLNITATQMLNKPGSWQDMFLVDQPLREISADLCWELNTSPATIVSIDGEVELTCEEGFTVGSFFQQLLETPQDVVVRVYDGRQDSRRKCTIKEVLSKMLSLEKTKKKKKGPWILDAGVTITVEAIVAPTEEEREQVAGKVEAASKAL